MKALALALSAAIAVSAIPVSAAQDQWPSIKPGYWEVSTVFFSDFQHPVVAHYCIDDKSTGVIKSVIETGLDRSCSHRKESVGGHRVFIDAICKIPSTEYTLHLSAEFPTDSNFRSTSSTHYIRPSNTPDLFVPKNGRRVGACPKDFQPGDAMLNDGEIVHITPDGQMRPINPG